MRAMPSNYPATVLQLAVVLVLLLISGHLAAEDPGERIPDGALILDTESVDQLFSLALNQSIVIPNFPINADETRAVRLTRRRIYNPGSTIEVRIVEAPESGGEETLSELEPSGRKFIRGRAVDSPRIRVSASLESVGLLLGHVHVEEGIYLLGGLTTEAAQGSAGAQRGEQPGKGSAPHGSSLAGPLDELPGLPPLPVLLTNEYAFECQVQQDDPVLSPNSPNSPNSSESNTSALDASPRATLANSVATRSASILSFERMFDLEAATNVQSQRLRSADGALSAGAVLALDTDSTFLSRKFGNVPEDARDWIEDAINQSNLTFELDLDLEVLLGDVILRIGEDPYENMDLTATSAALFEFASYYRDVESDRLRTFAMLLSGNSAEPEYATGIAAIDAACQPLRSYALSQVYVADVDFSNDVRLLTHEIVHMLGSRHTHCYSPAIDQCFNQESTCHNGPIVCPAIGRGSLMSYCNISGCTRPNFLQLDDRVLDHVAGRITEQQACFQALGLFADGFETGSTSAW